MHPLKAYCTSLRTMYSRSGLPLVANSWNHQSDLSSVPLRRRLLFYAILNLNMLYTHRYGIYSHLQSSERVHRAAPGSVTQGFRWEENQGKRCAIKSKSTADFLRGGICHARLSSDTYILWLQLRILGGWCCWLLLLRMLPSSQGNYYPKRL